MPRNDAFAAPLPDILWTSPRTEPEIPGAFSEKSGIYN